jgi:hypothetical protein
MPHACCAGAPTRDIEYQSTNSDSTTFTALFSHVYASYLHSRAKGKTENTEDSLDENTVRGSLGGRVKVGSHDKTSRISWYKILYQATGVSPGKFSPPLHGNFASFGCFGQYVCKVACPPSFFLR